MSSIADNVYAFEPFEDLIHCIEDKIKVNDLKNIRIFPFALGDENGRVEYFPGLSENPGAGSLIKNFPGVSEIGIPVEIRKGDELVDSDGLPKIDLLKLDVQGFESQVLRGLSQRIGRDRPIILSELSQQTRAFLGSEAEFRRLFYEGALFGDISGRNGRTYRLKPFSYERSEEVLVLPAELGGFLESALHSDAAFVQTDS
jgi:FkbM family methyltransferase